MKFSYEETSRGRDYLSTKTDHGVAINIEFFNGDLREVYVDFMVYDLSSDTIDGIFVVFSGKFMPLTEVIEIAVNQYPAIIAEVEQEQADEEAHEREMSSPEKTGRI